VITSLEGESWSLVGEAGCGVRYTAGDAQSLRDAIHFVAEPERRRTMAAAARATAVRFDAASLYGRYVNEIEALAP
jgi:glycosyltransferase involved in cell wall biosynthesis